MTNLNQIKQKRDAMRNDFFRAFPDPSCKERQTWKSLTGMLNNSYEGDIRGGETGHADSAYDKALRTLNNLEDKMRG